MSDEFPCEDPDKTLPITAEGRKRGRGSFFSKKTPVPFSRRNLQVRLLHLFYAIALLGAGLATFGAPGVGLVLLLLGFWGCICLNRSPTDSLVPSCLLALCCLYFISLLVLQPAISISQAKVKDSHCRSHLKLIAVALHNYHDRYGSFPPAFVEDGKGEPVHSWRVLILPFLGRQDLYERYSFSEPWDGPNNRQLLKPAPLVYQCPSDPRDRHSGSALTSYVAVVGPRTAWPGETARKISDFPDGTHGTILVMEDQSKEILWMEPRDPTLEEAIRTSS
jgi:hypothetical protein